MTTSKRNILVGLTGSIACYKTCDLISQLVKAGHSVQCVATPSALQFVGDATLEGLTGRPVLSNNFVSGHMMSHIQLARWADIFVVAPMSAAHLSQFAYGLSTDLLTTLYLAFEQHKPVFVAPAMNTVMWGHPAVQSAVHLLKSRRVQILLPTSGRLACGEEGQGKMMSPDEIMKSILTPPSAPQTRGHVLVTYGGTIEPIDGVRAITNTSTGRTGAEICETLCNLGYHVHALRSERAIPSQAAAHSVLFKTYKDFKIKISNLLKENFYDAVIHLAALSDYSIEKIVADGHEHLAHDGGKIDSGQQLQIILKKNEKIVNQIKHQSANKSVLVFAFKLTNTLNSQERVSATLKLLKSPGIDFVAQNDLHEIISAQPGSHPFLFFTQNESIHKLRSTEELAQHISLLLQSQTKLNPSEANQNYPEAQL